MAAATAFYFLLSLVPLALLTISLLGHLVGTEEVRRRVVDLVEAGAPEASGPLVAAIQAIAGQESRWFVNLLGLFALVWSGVSLLGNLSAFLTIAWIGHAGGATFFRRKLMGLGALVTAGVLFLLSVAFTSLAGTLNGAQVHARGLAEVRAAVDWLISTVVATGMFFLLYRFLPAARVSSRAALLGAVVAAVLWHISRRLFVLLVASSAAYGEIYGPLAGVVVLMLWIYYSCLILFVCAELAAAYQEQREPAPPSGGRAL